MGSRSELIPSSLSLGGHSCSQLGLMGWFIHPSWGFLNGAYLKQPPTKGWGPSFAVSWPSRIGFLIWRARSLSHSLRCGGNWMTFGKRSITFNPRVPLPSNGRRILHHCSKVEGQESTLLVRHPPLSLLLLFSSSCGRSSMSFVNLGSYFVPTWMSLVFKAFSWIQVPRS
jgi:hypothetical protein